MRTLAGLVNTMRPDQWTKNLVLFAGLLFAGGMGEGALVALAASGFVIFCGLSGATYVLNDIIDAGKDREHPAKRDRPIASGALPIPVAASGGVVAFHLDDVCPSILISSMTLWNRERTRR